MPNECDGQADEVFRPIPVDPDLAASATGPFAGRSWVPAGSCSTRADRSNGQEAQAGLACSMGDGPASPSQHQRHAVNVTRSEQHEAAAGAETAAELDNADHRAIADERAWTVTALARWYRVKPDVILAFIKAGTLKALILAAPGSKQPRWRILPEDHAAFEVTHGHELSESLHGQRGPLPLP